MLQKKGLNIVIVDAVVVVVVIVLFIIIFNIAINT